jgi:hypothetical protein
VAAYDFPETVADLQQMAANAAFRESTLLERFTQHHVLVFRG